jgi:hypothetical protein
MCESMAPELTDKVLPLPYCENNHNCNKMSLIEYPDNKMHHTKLEACHHYPRYPHRVDPGIGADSAPVKPCINIRWAKQEGKEPFVAHMSRPLQLMRLLRPFR